MKKSILASAISALAVLAAFAKEQAYRLITGYMSRTGLVLNAFPNSAISDIIA